MLREGLGWDSYGKMFHVILVATVLGWGVDLDPIDTSLQSDHYLPMTDSQGTDLVYSFTDLLSYHKD